MLSGYFGMSLDELVKDMDVQNVKYILGKWCKMVCYAALPYEAPPPKLPFLFSSFPTGNSKKGGKKHPVKQGVFCKFKIR